jgi:hypothetical protein
MRNATLNIGKSLTVVTGNCVYTTNLSSILIEANKYDQINLNGVTKTEKLNKYINILKSNGYIVVVENWNRANEIADGLSDFSIKFSK